MRNCIVVDVKRQCDTRLLGIPYSHNKDTAPYEGPVESNHSLFFRNGFPTPAGLVNIEADPRLTSDFHLEANSPCIDAGTNEGVSEASTDFESDPRIIHGVADIGPDEYDGAD